jgi:hypothetical protein
VNVDIKHYRVPRTFASACGEPPLPVGINWTTDIDRVTCDACKMARAIAAGPPDVQRGEVSYRPGIAAYLLRYARESGWELSVARAVHWKNVLRDMHSIANDEQREAIKWLMGPVDMHWELAQSEERKVVTQVPDEPVIPHDCFMCKEECDCRSTTRCAGCRRCVVDGPPPEHEEDPRTTEEIVGVEFETMTPCLCPDCNIQMTEQRGPLAPGGPIDRFWVCPRCQLNRMWPDDKVDTP